MTANTPIQTLWAKVRAAPWGRGSATLWIVGKYSQGTEAAYTVRSAGLGTSLKRDLVALIRDVVAVDVSIEEYSPVATDQDERIFWARTEETDFASIHAKIDKGSSAEAVGSLADIKNSWAVVTEINVAQQRLFAFTKLRGNLSFKKSSNLFNVFFDGTQFEVVEHEQTVTLPKRIDFLVYDNNMFILDRQQFELGLNMREGLMQVKMMLCEDIKSTGLMSNPDEFVALVGDKKRALRRLALIHDNGYYKDPQFLADLVVANEKNKWGLSIDGGKIRAQESQIELLLTLLNNDRVASMINSEKFDVEVKHKIE